MRDACDSDVLGDLAVDEVEAEFMSSGVCTVCPAPPANRGGRI